MKNLLKKCGAALLAAVMLMGLVPLNVAGQSREGRYVNTAVLYSLDRVETAVRGEYELRFQWNSPQGGALIPIPAGAGAPTTTPSGPTTWTRFASGFEITFDNRSMGGTAPSEFIGRDAPAGGNDLAALLDDDDEIPPGTPISIDITRGLEHSSLYEISVLPSHIMPTWVPPTGAGATYVPGHWVYTETAPVVSPPENRPIIFMTDIRVRYARGSGQEIRMEWYNPLWNGQNVFDSWEIRITDADTGVTLTPARRIPFSDLEHIQGGRVLAATITHPSLQIGSSYTVSVEPIIGTVLARGITVRTLSHPIMGNVFFTFRDTQFHYAIEEPVLMVPELVVTVEGADFVRLNWDRLDTDQVRTIVVEQWELPFPDEPIDREFPDSVIAHIPYPFTRTLSQWTIGSVSPLRPLGFTILALDAVGRPIARSNLDFFIPGMAEFTPYSPLLEPIGVEFEAGAPNLTLTWRAFTRAPIDEAERDALPNPPHSLFPLIDRDRNFVDIADSDHHTMYYHIFISDSRESLQWETGQASFEPNYRVRSDPRWGEAWLVDVEGLPMLRWDGVRTYTRMEGGVVTEGLPLRDNAVFFVRIEAVRYITDTNRAITSVPSFGVIYIPPEDDLLVRAGMIDAPPLRGSANDPDDAPMIHIEWDLRYLEIGDPSGAPEWHRWYASVGVDIRDVNYPQLVFGRQAQFMDTQYVRGWNALNNMLSESTLALLRDRNTHMAQIEAPVREQISSPAHLDLDITALDAYPLRIQDLYRAHYRIHVIEYSVMLEEAADMITLAPDYSMTLAQAFEAYREWLLLPENTGQWQVIGRPAPVDGVASHSIDALTGGGALEINTPYVVFFQPFEPELPPDEGLAFFPNYVIVTTPDVFVPAIPTPTTPVLFPGQAATDTTVSVRWRVQGEQPNAQGDPPAGPRSLFYEMRWSESILDFPEGGGSTVVPWSELEEMFTYWQHPVTRQWYYHFTLTDLFPDTIYYIWMRAYNIENRSSGWSNPIDLRTRDIMPPAPPRLGLASRVHLHAYNLANDTNYQPLEADAITLFVSRIFSDFRTHELPRATDGEAIGGTARLIDLPHLEEIYTVRFEELMANRHYYVRARTILTITRDGGSPNREYSYEVQVADNEDFLDAVTFIVPPLGELDPLNVRRAVSGWVTMETMTFPDEDEFDGAFRPEQFPLPDDDWEITYDSGTLIWRFRSNRIGADGRPDNQVDQRFISRLVDDRVSRFEVDLSHYAPRPDWPVVNRELVIPLSVLRAFDERLITLAINFGDITAEIPPGAFNTAAVRGLGMGAGSYARIRMETNATAAGLPALALNNRFASLPQRLSITAVTPARSLVLASFARGLEMTMNLPGVTEPGGVVRVGMFFTAPALGVWQDANGMSMTALRPGTFAAISRETPLEITPPQVFDPTRAAMERVTARITFTDMFTYTPQAVVSAQMFNNIMHALTNNASSVALNSPLTAAQTQSLQRARFLAPEDLTFEAAVDILVRFYELRSQRIIEPMTTPQMIIGFANVTPAFRQSILKGADIGFITGPLEPSPQRALTMGDIMVMLDIVIH